MPVGNLRVLLAGLALCLFAITTVQGEQCVACSYTQSSIASMGYECITNPEQFTNVTCNFTKGYVCYAKADYGDQQYSIIRWFTRGCELAKALGEPGCPPYGSFPSCLETCNTGDRCNEQFGDLYANGITNDSYTDDGNSASSVISTSGLVVLCVLLANLMSRRPR